MTNLLASMTGFARTEGLLGSPAWSWAWELRSVNGRGLDLRFRLPSGFDALEPALREAAGRVLKRGNVTANLTVKAEEPSRLAPDPDALDQVLALALDLQRRIPGAPPVRAEALLALPGVLCTQSGDGEVSAGIREARLAAVRQGFIQSLDQLVAMRRAEGTRLSATLRAQLDEVTALRDRADTQAAGQPAAQRARVLETLQALLREVPALPEERVAQEVALLATRCDVREELDRLASHIAAAQALLVEGAAVGRRFDFLVQEFNREANTLCSKSASAGLTETGLRLKAVIEQLREQVQNIE